MSEKSFSWENKVVAITGGGNGIGMAIAQAAKDLGAKVAISDINEKDLNKAKEEHGFYTSLSDAGKEADILSFIKNTEYKILANTIVKLSFYEKDLNDEFTVASSSDYLVSVNTISNLQNERTAVESIANELSKKIRTRVLLILNDL